MGRDTLGSDPLGAKGESRFQEICEDAGLICNKSTRDRAGWDFIVEFQFEDAEGGSLDSRAVPLSCHVQVKTLLTRTDRFKVRLSAAERLAKELKPAFLYVFKVDGTQFTAAYLIHIMDSALEKILRRLRELRAVGKSGKVNRTYISFSAVREGRNIEPTGEALQAAIQAACGPDLHEYSTRKAGQVRGLGFEPFPFRGIFRFRSLSGPEELVDVFLGIQRYVEVDHLEAFETRFGIPLPLREFRPDTHLLSIDPHPVDTCTVTVRDDELGLPTVFDAELFIPAIPNLPPRFFKFLVRSQLFSLLIPFQGQFTFWLKEDIKSQKHQPDQWVDLARLLLSLATGQAQIEIQGRNRITPHVEWSAIEAITAFDSASCRRWLTVCQYTTWLFRSAGVSREQSITIQDIDGSGGDIVEAYALFNGKVNGISLRTTKPDGAEIDTPARTLIANYVRVGEVIIVYYILVDLLPEIGADYIQWTSIRIIPGQMRPLRKTSGDFANFVEYAMKMTGVKMVLVQRSPEDILSASQASVEHRGSPMA
jgi:hypothetical protein